MTGGAGRAYLLAAALVTRGKHSEDRKPVVILGELLDEAGAFAPERYKAVGMLMQLDMVAWKSKDLSDIARKMKDVERRLDLARGGKITQEKQKEILARLDEVIKKLENQANKPGGT